MDRPKRDALLVGPVKNWSIATTDALRRAIERAAEEDGYDPAKERSEYVRQALVIFLRAREAEQTKPKA